MLISLKNISRFEVNLKIGASNLNSPIFHQTKYSFTVSDLENGPIGKISATDSDAGSYGELTYFIMEESQSKPFAINKTSGEIFIDIGKILPEKESYDITAGAIDIGYEPRKTLVPIEVKFFRKTSRLPVLIECVTNPGGECPLNFPTKNLNFTKGSGLVIDSAKNSLSVLESETTSILTDSLCEKDSEKCSTVVVKIQKEMFDHCI